MGEEVQGLPGRPVVIPRAEHCISRSMIDPEALKVLYRLNRYGFKAFLVGGGVRDLLLGKAPKDFDIGTDARPEEVRRIFRNCRIIGRRFRLAHVFFYGNKIVEVATFRANSEPDPESEKKNIAPDNTYGDAETDSLRRDLTINGLFYDISNFSVIDYVGGITDLRDGIIRIIGEPKQRIEEDPVRMIRVLRHAARTGFQIEEKTFQAVSEKRNLIRVCPLARIYDEFLRDVQGGSAAPFFELLKTSGLLEPLFPSLWRALSVDGEKTWNGVRQALLRIDEAVKSGVEVSPAVAFFAIALADGGCVESVEKGVKSAVQSAGVYFLPEEIIRAYRELIKAPEEELVGRLLTEMFANIGMTRRHRETMEKLAMSRFRLFYEEEELSRSLNSLRKREHFWDLLKLLQVTSSDELRLQELQTIGEQALRRAGSGERGERPRRKRRRKAPNGNSRSRNNTREPEDT